MTYERIATGFFDRSEFSRVIGWEHKSIPIPDIKTLNNTYEQAKIKGSSVAAYDLFSWYRFCPSPVNDEEVEAMNKLSDYYRELFI
jgi:purine-nucleoside phosphorylase